MAWNNTAPSLIRPNTDYTTLQTATRVPGTVDGKALRLTLPADPEAGPMGGVGFETTKAYKYGTFGSRMKTADCTGQKNAPGVITAAFTYSRDHADTNGNGVTDNNEIDFEILCSQPDVVWMTIWTDYSETSNNLRSISRVVNVRTGEVLYNCYITAYGKGCEKPLPGENLPARTTPIPGFDASKQFRTYKFDWSADRVVFYTFDNQNRKVVLWDYRGPSDRIPQSPSLFMQNVWHSANWAPFGSTAKPTRPTVANTALIDSTFLPQ
nr:glycoside hydrolase family 16 protein [Kineosporia rhizophila]